MKNLITAVIFFIPCKVNSSTYKFHIDLEKKSFELYEAGKQVCVHFLKSCSCVVS